MEKEQRYESAKFIDGNFERALTIVLHDEGNQALWEQFRYAFEVRAAIPWLNEAEKENRTQSDRIASALTSAFAMHSSSPHGDRNESERQALDEDFFEALTQATEKAGKDTWHSNHLAHSIRHAGNQPKNMTPEEIAEEIKRSIYLYWNNHESGQSPDPW